MKKIRFEGGYSYLVLLFTVAIAAAGMAGTGIVWHTEQIRERETELLFVGNQFRAAIISYYARTPPGSPRRYPGSLDELLKDPRFPMTVRHLRKLYRDPITGTTDWGLMTHPGGGIMGVYSKSEALPLKRAEFDGPNRIFEDRALLQGKTFAYKDWQFAHVTPIAVRAPLAPVRPKPTPK